MSNSLGFVMDMFEEEEQQQQLMIATAGVLVHQHVQRFHQNDETKRGGSVMNHRVLDRSRVEGAEKLYRDYFSNNPAYPLEPYFRRRFRMHRPLFLRIQRAIEAHDQYFVQKNDAVGAPGLLSLQKITAAMRMLAYGTPADAQDDYCRIAKSTTIKSLRRFVKGVVEVFGNEYLRRPNATDVARLMETAEERGFPGMLGSIDCMHWRWKNCPTSWHGTYTGHIREPTIILEAVASYDLWIWHAFFGLPGSLNDINVLDRSHVFAELAEGRGPEVRYSINGNNYNMGYYLADGIYPSWSTFVKTIPSPQGNKRKYFAAAQESARKDVERAFGVLQARFAIIRGPARMWDVETMRYIMLACIIMHNMIVEDEREIPGLDYNYDQASGIPRIELIRTRTIELMEFVQIHERIQDRTGHTQLQNDLIEHIWQKHGG